MKGMRLAKRSRSQHAATTRATRSRAGSLRIGVAAMACVSAFSISACDLRLETEPIVFPSPDATTLERDSLADAAAMVLAAASDAGTSADDVAVGAATTAQAHLDALGGVYVAYPSAPPSPSPSPTPSPTLTEAIAGVRATAESVAASTEDANLAFLARSITLDWSLRELWAKRVAADAAAAKVAADALAQASVSPPPDPSASDPSGAGTTTALPKLLPGDSGDALFPRSDGETADADGAGFAPASAALTGLTAEQLTALSVAEDEARFAYETIAALEFSARRDAVLMRSLLHGARSDALAALVAADAARPDPRTPLYQLRDADLADAESRVTLSRSIEIDLGASYAALLDGASAADAQWILNASFDAYARAMATGGFTTADLPTLPGIVVAE